MWYLYAELFVLLLVSFLGGSAAAALAVRLMVRRTEQPATSSAHAGAWTTTEPVGEVR